MRALFSPDMYVSTTFTLTTITNTEHENQCMELLRVSTKVLAPVYFRNL